MKRIFPEKIFFTWDIMYECNYNCTYCFLNFEETKEQFKTVVLTPQEWFEIWKDIYDKYGEAHVQLTGGEPFFYPDFINLIAGLSKIHTFSISTNLFWDIDEFIAKTEPKKIRVDAAFHPEFSNADKFLNKLIKLRKQGYITSVTMVAYPPLLEKIKDIGKVFKLGGFDLILYPYRGPYQNRCLPKEYSDQELLLLEDLGLNLGRNISKRLENRHLTTKFTRDPEQDISQIADSRGAEKPVSPQNLRAKACRMGQRYAKILPNADAFRCCASVWNETKTWENWGSLGNLRKGTFKLLERPGACNFWESCLCYKSMVIGEEDRWLKEWKDIYQMQEDLDIKKELEKIKALRDAGDFKATIESIKKVLTKRSQDIQALTLLAECHAELGNFKEAEKIIKHSLKNNFDSDNLSWLYRVLSKVYNREGITCAKNTKKMKEKFNLALDYLSRAKDKAVESNNLIDQSEAYYEMAEVFYLLKDFNKALIHLDKAINYQPEKKYFFKKREQWSAERNNFDK